MEANLGSAWATTIELVDRFWHIRRNGLIYAAGCADAFLKRIFVTEGLAQLLLGFLVTSGGLTWYRRLPNHPFPGSSSFSKDLVLQEIRPFQLHFQVLLGIDGMVADRAWAHYLGSAQYRHAESATQFWQRHQSLMIPDANGRLCVPYRRVAEIAQIVARLPCSEAGVEGAFSCLGLIIGDHRRSIRDDVAEVLLIIRLHGIPNGQGASDIVDKVRGDPLGDDPGDWIQDERDRAPPPPPDEDASAPASQPQPRPVRWGEHALELRIRAQRPGWARPG
jgi:hypothetical protein